MSDFFYAHSKEGKPPEEWHRLKTHLLETAKKAEKFAGSFGNGDWAYLAGLWHDLGKYSNNFQAMLFRANGFEAHIEKGRVDHSTAGAIHAMNHLGDIGRILSYLVAGHHAGLPDWSSVKEGGASLEARLTRGNKLLETAKKGGVPADILNMEKPSSKPPDGISRSLWLRMIFSCLVDADFLDTESFMNEEKTSIRGDYPPLSELKLRFDEHIHTKTKNADKNRINDLRNSVLEQCLKKAELDPAIFTLTVPTGGGKTLSSMAFAMRHAVIHKKRRIIYVIPYTSIIEQTANVFRKIFGDSIIEHHSNIEEGKNETTKSRLACENWDAPIIVTTNVQFLESFFAARSSRCRKLHNVVNSVVIFDEVQLFPPDFLNPVLHLINQLFKCYKVTPVLCTATQPAFKPDETVNPPFKGLAGLKEIIQSPEELHKQFKRVEINLPSNINEKQSWEAIAEILMEHETVLCIVNSRKNARELFQLMPKDTVHLSAMMCGAHRMNVIGKIKESLKAGKPVRVISTQLIECGVDIDFPVVFRAMSGLDSISQAAGRCNREGKLKNGEVHVFIPPDRSPPGHLRQMEESARQILAGEFDDLFSPAIFDGYFKNLFWIKGENLDRHDIRAHLRATFDLKNIDFRTAAKKFRLIDDGSLPIITKYMNGENIIEELRRLGPKRWLMRKAQRYTVNVRKNDYEKLLASNDIELLHDCIYVQKSDNIYCNKLGFMADNPTAHKAEGLMF